MKVLLVAHGFPPYDLGGVEVYTQWLARELAARHEVTVFAPRTDPRTPDFALTAEVRDGIRVVTVNNLFCNYDPLLEVCHPRLDAVFAAFLARETFDLVHFQHMVKLSATFVDRVRERGRPALFTLHDYWFLCPLVHLLQRDHELCPAPGSVTACVRCEVATSYLNREEAGTYYLTGMLAPMMAPAKWRALKGIQAGRFDPVYPPDEPGGPEFLTLRRGLIRRFLWDRYLALDALTSPSRFLRDFFGRHGLPTDRVRVLPNVVDTTGLRPGERPPPPPPLRVLFLGTLAKHKGVHVLVEAANRLAGAPVEFTVCGGTPDERYRRYLEGLRRNPRLRFHGPYGRRDLAELLGRHHVVVVPSIWYENHPIVIREAFAAGVPVVAARLGALPEFVRHEGNGLLFRPGDPEALAAALQRLLNDPALLPRLAAAIPPASPPGTHLAALEALYGELRRRPPTPPRPGRSRRILLAGPTRCGVGFPLALAEALVAGPPPWPTVLLWGGEGELEPSLAACRDRLGLAAVVRRVATPEEAGPVDLAVALQGDLLPPLRRRGLRVLPPPPSAAALAARLAGEPRP